MFLYFITDYINFSNKEQMVLSNFICLVFCRVRNCLKKGNTLVFCIVRLTINLLFNILCVLDLASKGWQPNLLDFIFLLSVCFDL